jgi:hypothetical protein
MRRIRRKTTTVYDRITPYTEIKFDAPYTAYNDYRIRSYMSVVYIRGAESTRVRVRPIGKIFENLFASEEIF